MKTSKLNSAQRGFTLIELLVVMAILGILVALGVGNFASARLKARDAQRKSDLATITKALEAYANDHSSYINSDGSGNMSCTPPATCAWGGPFQDAAATLYAASLPDDPNDSRSYYYTSDGTTYTLYAALENVNDPALDATISEVCGATTCNYKVTSTNTN